MAQESLSQVGLTLVERSAESASFAGKTVGGVGLIDILDLRSENAYVTTSGLSNTKTITCSGDTLWQVGIIDAVRIC